MQNTVSPLERGHLLDPLEILRRCGGYYERPPNGPLVGYAGRDSLNRAYVGEVYVNFATAERHGPVLRHFAETLTEKLVNDGILHSLFKGSTGFCGAPEGGKALACMLAQMSVSVQGPEQYIYPEKEVISVKTEGSSEQSRLVFSRHEPGKGEVWWIVEDICNNFSTTADLVRLIESFGAQVAGILCFLNRSVNVDHVFQGLPVVPIVRKKIEQYQQDDPYVAALVQSGRVVWKPKTEWHRLAEAMQQAH